MRSKTNWWMIVAITSLILLFFNRSGMMSFGGFGCGNYGSYSGSMMSWMWGSPFGTIFSFLTMIILSGLAIWIIVYFIRIVTDSLNQQKSFEGKNGKRKNH